MGQDNSHPQPGDLIEIDREFYQHWALYVGDGYIIHMTDEHAPSMSASNGAILTRKTKVKKQFLKMVVCNHKWRVNNKYDHSRTPRPVEEIIWSGEQWIDKEVTYNVLTSNCEHFVTMLRYGEGVSEQWRTSVGCKIPVPDMTDDKVCPNPGDLIEIKKGSFAQWALYVGDGYVIHVTPVDENAAHSSATSVTIPIRKVKATKEILKEVVGNDDWAVNNNHDLYHTPLPVKEIIQRAEGCIGKELPYDELGLYSEDFVTELRYGSQMKTSMSGCPKLGDLIEIDRPGYQHWALYVWSGYVIHVTLVDENAQSQSASNGTIPNRKAKVHKVKKERLEKVVGNHKWRVNNKYDFYRTPRPIGVIMQRAMQWIDKKWRYELLHNNSEHFVTMLRYGGGVSGQVRKAAPDIASAADIATAACIEAVVGRFLPAALAGMSLLGSIFRR